MIALAGTLNALAALLDTLTVAVLAAALVNVTVQVEIWPCPNVLGEQLTDDSCVGPARFSENVCDPPFALAVRIAVWSVVTVAIYALNATVVAPAGTVTLPGTYVLVLLLASVTGKPPAGAAALSVTAQVDEPGAFTVPGEQLKLLTATCGSTVTVAVRLSPFQSAVTVTG